MDGCQSAVVHALDEGETARAIMTSLFSTVVPYSVLDAGDWWSRTIGGTSSRRGV